jgi:hypothetical protein
MDDLPGPFAAACRTTPPKAKNGGHVCSSALIRRAQHLAIFVDRTPGPFEALLPGRPVSA